MKKNAKIVGFDLDDVILNHIENKLSFAKRLGIPLRPEETASDLISGHLSADVHRDLQRFLYNDPIAAFSPPLYEGVAEGLEFLKKSRTPYFLISRRHNPNFSEEVLRKKDLWPRFFQKENTFFVKEKKDKDIKAVELGVSIYIDDQPSVLAELVSVPHKFLFDLLRAHTESEGYTKVRSWREFLTIVGGYET